MAWFGAFAAVAVIVFLPGRAFFETAHPVSLATHPQILVYYIPERKRRFAARGIAHSAGTDSERTSRLSAVWRTQLVAGQRAGPDGGQQPRNLRHRNLITKMAPNFGAIFAVKLDGREPGQTP
jgi:hypothetical protein